jgi:hypothetical protein
VQDVRNELRRALEGISVADMGKRVAGINSVVWIVGHLAWQEQRYWLERRGLALVSAELVDYGSGKTIPAHMDSFDTLFASWQEVTESSDEWLWSLQTDDLRHKLPGDPEGENIGSKLMRVIGHYYLHIGQITAVRKILGYSVPQFVGSQEGALFE